MPKRKNSKISEAIGDIRAYLAGDKSRVRITRFYVIREKDIRMLIEWVAEDVEGPSRPVVPGGVKAKRAIVSRWRRELAKAQP